jgi:hypothetical protein
MDNSKVFRYSHMPKLTDMQIRAWIKSGERFEGRADGDGLYLRFRKRIKLLFGAIDISWRGSPAR